MDGGLISLLGTIHPSFLSTHPQVLLMLMSPTVTIAHRPKDKSLIKKATEAAQKQYKDASGRDVKVEYDGSLPDDSAGGVVGSTMGGKIKVDNTLDERLKILQEKVRAGAGAGADAGLMTE
jgi:V-type H+-transporting ATPase subunit E